MEGIVNLVADVDTNGVVRGVGARLRRAVIETMIATTSRTAERAFIVWFGGWETHYIYMFLACPVSGFSLSGGHA